MKIYEINKSAFNNYIKNVKHGKHSSYEAVRRKLTALIISTMTKRKIDENTILYIIGNFRIVVKNGIIDWVFWTQKYFEVPRKLNKRIKNNYCKLGLTSDGSKIINDNIIFEQIV